MPRKPDKPLEAKLIRFYQGDLEVLRRFFPKPVGYNMAVREIIHLYARRLEERASREGILSNVGHAPDQSIIDGLLPVGVAAGGSDADD